VSIKSSENQEIRLQPSTTVLFLSYRSCSHSQLSTDIMLQLKRTVEVISVLSSTDDVDGGGRGRIKTILDGALSAGKAARNEKIVPEIKKLKAYGSDGTPPSALAKEVADVRNYMQYILCCNPTVSPQ
jgi:hypothetical protein